MDQQDKFYKEYELKFWELRGAVKTLNAQIERLNEKIETILDQCEEVKALGEKNNIDNMVEVAYLIVHALATEALECENTMKDFDSDEELETINKAVSHIENRKKQPTFSKDLEESLKNGIVEVYNILNDNIEKHKKGLDIIEKKLGGLESLWETAYEQAIEVFGHVKTDPSQSGSGRED